MNVKNTISKALPVQEEVKSIHALLASIAIVIVIIIAIVIIFIYL